ncbi:hypothetical protein LPUS_09833 [Lasallia pustulata]|uniref:Uncharacterized protein n=1 Tax=Lasallia pustulata TaxID=136370 RepID=A0A1W5D8F2_9LECA|nr:hypothetical protein LPUS_09833 [Lasallia pustulata]
MYAGSNISSYGGPRSSRSSPTISHHGVPLKLAPTANTTWSVDEIDTRQEVGIRPERKRLKKRKNRVAGLRQEIMGNRLRLRERRRELRDEQANALDLETKLMQSMRKFWELGVLPDKSTLDKVYANLKEARDRLGPLEDNYDREEDEHNALEFQLDEEEAQLLDNHTGPDGQSTQPATSESEAAASGALNPMIHEYYSRIGDANIIHERLSDLQLEHTQLLDDAEFRKNHNVKLYAENAEFLTGIHKRYDELNADLEQAEADIAKLGQRATEMGFSIESRSPIRILQPRLLEKRPIFKETTPVLHRITQTDEVLPYLLSDYTEVRARISRWISNNLRCSPIERVKYGNIPLEDLERDSIDDGTWAHSVFEYWRNSGQAESFDGSWDDIRQQDGFRSQNVHLLNGGENQKLNLPLGTRKAWKAVRDHDVFFGEGVKDYSAYREESIRATRDRGYPYPENSIELELFPEYESRSA